MIEGYKTSLIDFHTECSPLRKLPAFNAEPVSWELEIKYKDYDISQSKVISTRITDDGRQIRVVRIKKKKKKVVNLEDT